MGLFGSTLDLESDSTKILLRVPHLQTEAKLVLGIGPNQRHVVAWEGWNGRQVVRSSQLRWATFYDDYDEAEEAFYARLEEGPKRFKKAKKRDYQPGRVWKWWCDKVTPKAQPATLQEVQKVVTKLYTEKNKKLPTVFVQGSGRRSTFKYRTTPSGVREYVMYVQQRPTIPRVLLDALWPVYGHAYTPALVLALMEGLVRFAKYDRGEVRAQVRSYRLKVAKKAR